MGIEVTQIAIVPEASLKLPKNELYVQLGCVACPNKVCFKATGVTSEIPEWSTNPAGVTAIREATGLVEKGKQTYGYGGSTWVEACEEPCPEAEEIRVAVELINETIGADLQVPEQVAE